MKTRQSTRLILLVATLLATMVVSVLGDEIWLATIGSGSGPVHTSDNLAKLTLGQGIIGRTTPDPGGTGIRLGIWECIRRTPVFSSTPDAASVYRHRLHRNYPNPFNPSTCIDFELAQQVDVTIELYDLRGRRVDTLLEGVMPAGHHRLTYAPRHLASGVYFVTMNAGPYRATHQIMLIK